jgi:DNA mismatch endonuclease (patch repair protein)
MVDVVDKKTRSRMMSGIRAKNTTPEMQIRSLLHRSGFRFRLHRGDLPGKPDLVLPKYDAVLFVHGCFWHCHRCHMFKWPKSNVSFWRKKITGNKKRDERHVSELRALGWRVLTIWECALRGPSAKNIDRLLKQTKSWLHSKVYQREVSGKISR